MITRVALTALLGHWRRHPVELITLLVGLAVATALWSGVQALNAQARASYAAAAALLAGDDIASIRAIDGQPFALADYVSLRRAGWKVSPVLEGDWRRFGVSLRILGVDPVTLPPGAAGLGPDAGDLRAFLTPPHLGFAAPETVARLSGIAGLPPLRASGGLPPDTLMVDISEAERLLGSHDRVSRLLLPAAEATRPLPADIAARLNTGAARSRRRPRAADRQLSSQPHRLRLSQLHRRPVHRLRGDRPRLRAAQANAAHAARLRRPGAGADGGAAASRCSDSRWSPD